MSPSKRSFDDVSSDEDEVCERSARRKISDTTNDVTLPLVADAPTLEETSSESESSDDVSDSAEYTSSGSESSDSEEESDAEDEEIVTVIPLNKQKAKPQMKVEEDDRQSNMSLRQRLKELLPRMAASNRDLIRERDEGTLQNRNIEGVSDDDEGYIEMDLGLGVLEQQRQNDSDTSSESESSDDESPEGYQKEADVLGKLMRQNRTDSVGIEVLQDG